MIIIDSEEVRLCPDCPAAVSIPRFQDVWNKQQFASYMVLSQSDKEAMAERVVELEVASRLHKDNLTGVIARLQAQRQALVAQREAIKGVTERFLGYSPIRHTSLPESVFALIFTFICCTHDPDWENALRNSDYRTEPGRFNHAPATVLSKVCRYWRTLVSKHPVLFSTFYVTYRSTVGDIERFLSRSKDLPIDIYIVDPTIPAFRRIVEARDRWRTVAVRSDCNVVDSKDGGEESLQDEVTNNQTETFHTDAEVDCSARTEDRTLAFPQLESLTISRTIAFPFPKSAHAFCSNWSHEMPKLRHAHIRGRFSHLKLPLAQLHSIVGEMEVGLDTDIFDDTISVAQKTLLLSHGPYEWANRETQLNLHLSRMIVDLRCWVCPQNGFRGVELPSLEHVEVYAARRSYFNSGCDVHGENTFIGWTSTLASLISRSKCQLSSLVISMESQPLPASTELVSLLDVCTSIRSLTIVEADESERYRYDSPRKRDGEGLTEDFVCKLLHVKDGDTPAYLPNLTEVVLVWDSHFVETGRSKRRSFPASNILYDILPKRAFKSEQRLWEKYGVRRLEKVVLGVRKGTSLDGTGILKTLKYLRKRGVQAYLW